MSQRHSNKSWSDDHEVASWDSIMRSVVNRRVSRFM